MPEVQLWAHALRKNNFIVKNISAPVPLSFMNNKYLRIWYIREFNIFNAKKIKGIKVIQERPNGSRKFIIEAETAEWLDGEWWFFNPNIQEYTEDDAPIKKDHPQTMHPVCFYDFNEEPDDFKLVLIPPDMQNIRQTLRYLSNHTNLSKITLAEKWTDLHSHMAMPWACTIVTFFAIPIALKTGRQSMLIGIFTALALFFGFYASHHIGLFLAKSCIIPPWLGAWLANFIFLAGGLLMFFSQKQ